jgi:hypothetical protein
VPLVNLGVFSCNFLCHFIPNLIDITSKLDVDTNSCPSPPKVFPLHSPQARFLETSPLAPKTSAQSIHSIPKLSHHNFCSESCHPFQFNHSILAEKPSLNKKSETKTEQKILTPHLPNTRYKPGLQARGFSSTNHLTSSQTAIGNSIEKSKSSKPINPKSSSPAVRKSRSREIP